MLWEKIKLLLVNTPFPHISHGFNVRWFKLWYQFGFVSWGGDVGHLKTGVKITFQDKYRIVPQCHFLEWLTQESPALCCSFSVSPLVWWGWCRSSWCWCPTQWWWSWSGAATLTPTSPWWRWLTNWKICPRLAAIIKHKLSMFVNFT